MPYVTEERPHVSQDEEALILCSPRSVFSTNFDLEGDGHTGSVYLNWMNEQGNVRADRQDFIARKLGVFSGQWILVEQGSTIAEAKKRSVFTRTIEMQSPMGALVLRPISMMGRSFVVERSGEVIATIIPEHILTRRSWIMIDVPEYDWPTICFVFWLIAMTWRRSQAAS